MPPKAIKFKVDRSGVGLHFPNGKKAKLRTSRSAASNLRSHPQTPGNQVLDDMVHSNIVGMLRGAGENFT